MTQFDSISLKQIVDTLADDLRPVLKEYGYMPNGYDSYVTAHMSRDYDGTMTSAVDLHLRSECRKHLTTSEWDARKKNVKSIILLAWSDIEDSTPNEEIRPLLTLVAKDSGRNENVWYVTIRVEFLVHGLPLVFSETHFSPR